MNIVPIKAGINKLISHIKKAAENIPTVFTEIKLKRTIATEPL